MRIGLFLLLFPSLAFAIGGCPVGVQLGNVTMATRLPVCLKFEGSEHGGCLVNCKGVCVELPLANTKGPVETTGTTCSWSDSNGSGNGDSDGSGNTPDEGNGGGVVNGWDFFQPVIGDATGTSVSGSVAKLNKNLGSALHQLIDGTKQDSNNINSIAHSAESLYRDMKTSLYHLDRMANDIYQSKNATNEILGRINASNDLLQSINSKMGSSGSGSGSGSSGVGDSAQAEKIYNELKQINANTFGPDFAQTHIGANFYNLVKGYQWDISSIKDNTHELNSTLNNFYWNTAQDLRNNSIEMNRNIKAIAEAINKGGTGSSDGSGGTGSGGEGQGIDYSKMPGSGENPLHVAGAEYNSGLCKGGAECFFDLETINNKYKETKNQLTNTYDGIKTEMADTFRYSFSGSAGVPKCFDMFSMFGRSYSICPDAGGYWEMLAAILMFIFYFIALMIVAKR
ncbi:hypothetical protein [Aeromonas hydrophila]|uniref:hypothetical protein n=1 Tax=Aeromonas hydrophila TaxID=644 RepID=UPI000A750559|nr:hypothetical protein [Aeromonas hydrophila]